jgi:hypothetical protein
MDDTMKIEKFKNLLSSLRTISVKNAASKLGIELSEILDILKEMENQGFLRIVTSKGCATSSCSSCDSGSCGTSSVYTGDEIVISLLFDRTKEYADE